MALIYLTPPSGLPQTKAGITFSDGGNYKINMSGTATGTAQLFFFYQKTRLPVWFEFDKTFNYKLNRTGSGTATFALYMFDSAGTSHRIINSSADGSFKVNSSTGYVGMSLSINITRNTTVSGSMIPTVEALIYTPRLNSQGIDGNPHYESRNPFYLAGYGMPNCTAYAFGRAWEIADPNNQYINYPPLSTGNADSWYNHADNWPRGSTPALGAIACYSGGIFSGDGHVCVVEEIDTANNRCRVSESAYNGYYFRATHFIGMDGSYGYGGYHFDGFIYNPFAGETPGPGPGPVEGFDIWKFKPLIYKKKGKYII